MTVQVADELARLHRLISGYEVPLRLPATALAGEACVWCERPADRDTVELEPVAALPRRACTACYTARLVWYITWYDWHLHVTDCTTCQHRRTCFVGHGRRVMHELTIGPAGKGAPACAACPAPLLGAELVTPLCWQGDVRPYLGYAHARCLTGRPSSR
ncbi:hypothetical protein ACWDUC_06375 [Streptomyces tricolor]